MELLIPADKQYDGNIVLLFPPTNWATGSKNAESETDLCVELEVLHPEPQLLENMLWFLLLMTMTMMMLWWWWCYGDDDAMVMVVVWVMFLMIALPLLLISLW